MTDNTVKTQSGVDVYLHDIYYYADEYVEKEHKKDEDKVADYFVDMVFYIADRIKKPNNDDIDLLDQIFDIYVRLCAKYRVLPTLEVFGFLVKINNSTFSDWMKGEYRASSPHSQTVKKWKEICKSMVIYRLHNQYGTNSNLIFTAKAAYGLVETMPTPTINPHQIPEQTSEQIGAKYGVTREEVSRLLEDGADVELPETPEG